MRHLHAKLYLVGRGRVIVTSANLTEAALRRNHEFGFVAEDAEIVAECRAYFSDLWERVGEDLCPEWLDEWDRLLGHYKGAGAPPHVPAPSEDFGTDLGLPPDRVPATAQGWIGEAEQAFVKFFGQSTRRAARDASVFSEVERSGSHFACTYPFGKRPRSVEDGAIMFLGRLVRDPNDVLIFGRAVGMRHVPGYDDASPTDLERRDWKECWPHYVRVHDAEFVAGSLGNGVSLDELMAELGPDAFASTRRNAQAGTGNVDPRRAYMRQPGVELSAQGMAWLSDRLERAFKRHGKLVEEQLSRLDWPQVPEARPERKP